MGCRFLGLVEQAVTILVRCEVILQQSCLPQSLIRVVSQSSNLTFVPLDRRIANTLTVYGKTEVAQAALSGRISLSANQF